MRTATLLLIVCPLFAQDAQPLPDGASLEIVVQEVQGEVDVRTSAKEKWIAATKGMSLAPGAKFCTGVGSAVAIAFGTNSVALVAECSVCEIRAFEVRGEELVANIRLEPGTAQVHVKQLAQFHTDFQVSTPRLTCSVKGSRGTFRSEGDEVPDFVRNDEGHVEAQGNPLAPTETTNSDGDTHQELTTEENVADTTPDGATESEQDPNQIANNAGSIDLNTSDATLNTDPSPSGGDNSTNVEPPPDDGGAQPPDTGPHTMDLVLMTLNGQDVTVHAADDEPGVNDGETGIEGSERKALLDLFLAQGIDAFLQAFLDDIHVDFHDSMSGIEISDPTRFMARHLEFHDDLPEAGFDALTTYLQAAAVQAAADPVDARDATLILASLFHTDFHVINSELPESTFVALHQEFHTDEMDPVLQAILDTDFEGALAMWGSLVHRTWHDNTGCDDFLDAETPCATTHQHFEGRLIDTGNNLRALTETLGIQTAEEELMVHTYLNHADIRGHSRDQNDILRFQLRHDHMDFEHNALGVTGLAAGVRHFDAADAHHEYHADEAGLQQSNPALFDQRHQEFHTSDSVFGLDGYIAFWSQVAEQARNQNVDRGALGHALIAGIDIDFLRASYSMQPGDSAGQYDFERAQFLQNVIDPMHALSDADQFTQLIHTYRDFLHGRWHDSTGVPNNVQSGQTGFEAHEHLHQSLDDFHTQTHTATGIPD